MERIVFFWPRVSRSPGGPVLPAASLQGSLEFLQACQLGQTERGSFVAKILAPVPPQINRQGASSTRMKTPGLSRNPLLGNRQSG